MTDYRKDFSSFNGKIWLNAASEGPLPLVAQKELAEAVEWKSKPYLLTNTKFATTVIELKKSIGRLMNVNSQDVILANSASYGLHLLANGLRWEAGDEILLMQNDFPTDILPWLALEKRKVRVRQIKSKDKVITPDELLVNITARTKLFCITHVHTFSGYVLEIEKFGEICREKGVRLVVNLSQSLATIPVDLSKWPVDAVVAAGYKWLCGPYGSGFCWIKPDWRDELDYNQAYWISSLSQEELQSQDALRFREEKGARKYDVFGTANFFNFVPFKAAIDYWLEIGVDKVRKYHDELIDRFIARLDSACYTFISPREGKSRSSLVVISHKDRQRNFVIHQRLIQQGIYTAFWKGDIRLSPHVYNTKDDTGKLLEWLDALNRNTPPKAVCPVD